MYKNLVIGFENIGILYNVGHLLRKYRYML